MSEDYAPIPPREFPPARTVVVPDRGEFFLRDSDPSQAGPAAADGPTIFMLHGWVASADLNFGGLYDDLVAAGYRVIAIDHRGHGRGLRSIGPFRLVDCADDAAAVIRTLGLAPVTLYGYSMGGAIAQLMAYRHPDLINALILSGTCQHWQEAELRRSWKAMPVVGLGLSIAPARAWRAALKRAGFAPGPGTAWLRSEMMRHSGRDVGEAGRELGRFDSRPWLKPMPFPTAVVVTADDDAVPPTKQRELAEALRARVFEAPVRHIEVAVTAGEDAARRYNPVLIEALESTRVTSASGSLQAT